MGGGGGVLIGASMSTVYAIITCRKKKIEEAMEQGLVSVLFHVGLRVL